jgi:hypothetical protein
MKVRQLWMASAGFVAALSIATPASALSELAPEFSCEPSQWTSGPAVSGGKFQGRLEAVCKFKAISNGTLADLEKSLSQEVVDKADKVHAGPTATTLNGMPATYFDATSTQTMNNMTATIRADVYFATDGSTRFVNSTKSKEINATGMAKNLKSIDVGFDLSPTGKGEYTVLFHTQLEVTKPGAVPAGIFKNQVVKGVEEEMEGSSEEMITKFVESL